MLHNEGMLPGSVLSHARLAKGMASGSSGPCAMNAVIWHSI
jgi:hypothetical protein